MAATAAPEIPEIIVVLGAALLPDGRPSPALGRRVDLAAALWREARESGRESGRDVRILVTGGAPGAAGSPARSEAAAMRARLRLAGLPDAALLVEDRARDTEQNARFSRPLILALGVRSVTLVTDPWHMPRARLCFALHGIAARPAPTAASPAPLGPRLLRRAIETLATPRSAALALFHRLT